jgi:hypothetical protein
VKAEWSLMSVVSVRVVDLTVKRFKNNVFKPNTRTRFGTPPSHTLNNTELGLVLV